MLIQSVDGSLKRALHTQLLWSLTVIDLPCGSIRLVAL